MGTHGNTLSRNAPHLYNSFSHAHFFWDGKSSSLEDQLDVVLSSKQEMDMSYNLIVSRLDSIEMYRRLFETTFHHPISKNTIKKAITSYEKTILTYSSRYDLYLMGDTNALGHEEKLGFAIFIGKGQCISCQKGANLTDNSFHNVGVVGEDLGRMHIDKIGMNKEFESSPYPFFSSFKAFTPPRIAKCGAHSTLLSQWKQEYTQESGRKLPPRRRKPPTRPALLRK